MTSFHRIAAYGLATALAVTVVVGIAKANLESLDEPLRKADRAIPARDGALIAASFALFEVGALEFHHPAGGVTIVTRSGE